MTDEHSAKAIHDFLSEAEEILEEMGQDALSVESALQHGGAVDPDVVNRLFRGAHSLKGVSGMFGFENLGTVAHRLEDLLDQLRMGKIPFDQDVLDFLLLGIDVLRNAVAQISAEGSDISADVSEPFAEQVERFVATKSGSTGDDVLAGIGIEPDLLSVLTEYEEHRLRENVRQGRNILRVSVAFPLLEFDASLSAATETIKQHGELITTLPGAAADDPDKIAFDLLVGTDLEPDELAQALADHLPTVQVVAKKKNLTPPPQTTAETVGDLGADDSLRSISQTVRVDIAKIDEISNLVGELVLIKSALLRLADSARGDSPTAEQIEISKQAKLLDRKLSELQTRVMDVRMVPLRQVFDKLNRIVRKVSRELGKEVEVVIQGADTELDKLLIEDLADPLMHIVRNAIDHGIETVDERLAAGKPARAKLMIRAFQKGNHVVIEVADDGRGIDADAVRKRAVERGLISPDQELSDEEVYSLLFEPGFSTRVEVSELSGRGVGLDVVKANLTRIGGLVDIFSERGKGTMFVLTLPITLAIIQALMVEVASEQYAIPLNAVTESLSVVPSEIETIENHQVLYRRGATLPLIRLADIFELEASESASAEELYVVVVGLAERRLGLLVDRLHGQQDVVIKSIGSILKSTPGIAGATDMGDSRTVLVLDVASIIDESARMLHG